MYFSSRFVRSWESFAMVDFSVRVSFSVLTDMTGRVWRTRIVSFKAFVSSFF
jgi:hypothetical protein